MIEELRRNAVLAALRSDALVEVARHAEIRTVRSGEVLYSRDTAFTQAIFPLDCVVSLMIAEEDRLVEAASIGREGFVGVALLFRERRALSSSTVQVSGRAAFVPMQALEEAFPRFACIQDAMLAYAQRFIAELMVSVSCLRLHRADRRVALWLSRAFARTGTASIEITHQALSEALGLRRATVTEACLDLQSAGTIDGGRGWITLCDPEALAEAACPCHGRLERLHATGAPRLPSHDRS
ncbi:Crp/Fnr family transcriptional regulator [Salinarimonas sp.]|uniref:Crp/Fnr family transcriptional regulator n=1 Tax=Salinarimonas sp. TaxID=2766526 RepID=UPI0032D9007A